MKDQLQHTMTEKDTLTYCKSKIHSLFRDTNIEKICIVPAYDRIKTISDTEKNDKLFNYKRPTAEIIDDTGYLYVFPGKDYVRHYKKIYERCGYKVTSKTPTQTQTTRALRNIFPADMPDCDVVLLGYVEAFVPGAGEWQGNDDIKWKLEMINGQKVVFVGVAFSYWGNIIYSVVEMLAKYCSTIIYASKLGSLSSSDIPNATIATGDSSYVDGSLITWNNIFKKSPLTVEGAHYTLPSVLDETAKWYNESKDKYRFVDPEIGWAAKAANDFGLAFSYLHLVTDNLSGLFSENLTTERESAVLKKRLQYVSIMRAILWHRIGAEQSVSLFSEVLKAQQSRVDKGYMEPLERNWKACLAFAYHTQEEAWEVVRELPRRQWKEQKVNPEALLSEIVDTQIQLLTTLAYAGFDEQDLIEGVIKKLHANRPDWKK